jgi:Tfp pilus assembly protein PilP
VQYLLLLLIVGQGFAQGPSTTITVESNEDPNDEFGVKVLMDIRDPFIRPKFNAATLTRTELERFETQEFELTAIITGPNQIRAMIVDPDGKTHFVKVGDKIGKKEGVVVQIGENDISIREKDVDYFGNKKTLMAKLFISMEDNLNQNNAIKTGGSDEAAFNSRFTSEELNGVQDDSFMGMGKGGSASGSSPLPKFGQSKGEGASAGTSTGTTSAPAPAPPPQASGSSEEKTKPGSSWQKYTR